MTTPPHPPTIWVMTGAQPDPSPAQSKVHQTPTRHPPQMTGCPQSGSGRNPKVTQGGPDPRPDPAVSPAASPAHPPALSQTHLRTPGCRSASMVTTGTGLQPVCNPDPAESPAQKRTRHLSPARKRLMSTREAGISLQSSTSGSICLRLHHPATPPDPARSPARQTA